MSRTFAVAERGECLNGCGRQAQVKGCCAHCYGNLRKKCRAEGMSWDAVLEWSRGKERRKRGDMGAEALGEEEARKLLWAAGMSGAN